MKFEIRHPFIVFHDNQPGQHARMSVGGARLEFHGGASSFNDARKEYEWAFYCPDPLYDGEGVIFETDDRAIVGKSHDGKIVCQGGDEPEAPRPVVGAAPETKRAPAKRPTLLPKKK